ncbi:metal ABC transporter solute-binding protein, Zn/Mn family [Guptibacillus hwajinpoensis]|uniref:Manganese/zinc/iron transport system substrate-binding protein n=1 Tax=Guptibacillus hwajinpoensis TaxID=208199 RepID=A0ABU0K2F6_9BACL|nr:zinc ABC transporter substrate-binding protein [Alkalihalobacillus hemicentroti]MDQ0483541.1 manganese/zinc/iron transport system substrate-binding protein [Alkalihalobacillus hemicentroti]
MKKWFGIVSACLLLVILGACSNAGESSEGEGKIKVTTTTGQIGDIAKNIGKDHVKVDSLMGPGIDPHLYKASQGDINKLSNADIIFYNGLHLEGKMGDIFAKMKDEKPTYPVAEAVPEDMLLADQENSSAVDPHVWFDINLWKYAVEEVRDGLIKLDPENKADYEKNTEVYLEELTALQTESQERINEIPEESRVLVTAHDAFQYFGQAYGMEVKGLQGLSTDSEYGLRDVQDLVNVLADRNIKAVFIESSISERSINAVVEGSKEKGHEVVIGGELFSDAMGEEGTPEGTYVGMYEHNIETITESLK